MPCRAFYRRNQGNLLSSDSCAMKKIDDIIRSEASVMPNVVVVVAVVFVVVVSHIIFNYRSTSYRSAELASR